MVIGLDLGTTNVKAILARPDGKWVIEAERPIRLKTTAKGVCEQDIHEIVAAAREVLGACAQAAGEEVKAIGVSAQGGALQIVAADGRPVGPVVGWMDARGKPWEERLTERLGREWFAEHTGHPRARGAVGQVLRLREESPDLLAPPYGIGFVGDVTLRHMCGIRMHDASSLSIAGLCNPRTRDADAGLLREIGIEPGQLPVLRSALDAGACLRSDFAREIGLPSSVRILPAVHDQYAAATGAGVLEPGDVMIGTGTAWVLLAATDRVAPPAGGAALVGPHVCADRWGQMLAPGVGGAVLDWCKRIVGCRNVEDVDAYIERVPFGCDGLRCIPFLAGLTPPGIASSLAGAFEGLRLHHGPGHLLRAVVEGLACETARGLRLIMDSGVPVRRLILTGGAARSRVTPRIIADVTGLPIVCLTRSAMSAHGAAVLARAAVEGGESDLRGIAEEMMPEMREIAPGPEAGLGGELAHEYEERIARFADR